MLLKSVFSGHYVFIASFFSKTIRSERSKVLAGCGQDEDNVPSERCLRRLDVSAQESQNCEQFLLLWSTRLGGKNIWRLCHQISHPLIISPSGTQLSNDLHLVAMLLCVFDENHLAMLSKRCNSTTRGFIGGAWACRTARSRCVKSRTHAAACYFRVS